MKQIIRYIWSLSTKSNTIPILGRWSLKHTNDIQNRVIDFNNYDHCGCCEYKFEHQPLNDNDDKLLPYFFE
jgi:hypothetical protein